MKKFGRHIVKGYQELCCKLEIVLIQRGLRISNLAHKHIHPDSLHYPDSEPRITLKQAIAETIGIPIGSINTPAEN